MLLWVLLFIITVGCCSAQLGWEHLGFTTPAGWRNNLCSGPVSTQQQSRNEESRKETGRGLMRCLHVRDSLSSEATHPQPFGGLLVA